MELDWSWAGLIPVLDGIDTVAGVKNPTDGVLWQGFIYP
jgi:hypothetical protein